MENRARILVVEDEQDMQTMLNFHLVRWGYEATLVGDASAAMDHIYDTDTPDLILLDWQLPGLSGIDLLKNIRRESKLRDIPVIMLTARDTMDDRVQGLDTGADDYIAKPFSPRELRARMQAMLRRTQSGQGDTLTVGDVSLNLATRILEVAGEQKRLGKPEAAIMQHLLAHPGAVATREHLLNCVWKPGRDLDERSLDVYISRLRGALRSRKKSLETVHGIGYRLSL